MAGTRMPMRPGPARSDRPVGSQPFARLLQRQAAIGWGVAAGWAAIWLSASGAIRDQVRTVEDLVNDQTARLADLAHTVEILAGGVAARVEPEGADAVGSSGPVGWPRLTRVSEQDHFERAGDRPDPATRLTVDG